MRSSLVLKYVNRVPSATPACLDISDVGAAVRPRSANRRVAASRMALRLSSLLGRATKLLVLLSIYSIIDGICPDGKPHGQAIFFQKVDSREANRMSLRAFQRKKCGVCLWAA